MRDVPPRPKTRVERGLPEKAPKKKAKKNVVRHDSYDPGHTYPSKGHLDGAECPIEGCLIRIFTRCTPDNVKPCPLGRGCDTIPRRFT